VYMRTAFKAAPSWHQLGRHCPEVGKPLLPVGRCRLV